MKKNRKKVLAARKKAEFKNIQGKIRHVFKKDFAAELKPLLGYCRCNLQTLRAAIGATRLPLKFDKMSGMYELRPPKVIASLEFDAVLAEIDAGIEQEKFLSSPAPEPVLGGQQ